MSKESSARDGRRTASPDRDQLVAFQDVARPQQVHPRRGRQACAAHTLVEWARATLARMSGSRCRARRRRAARDPADRLEGRIARRDQQISRNVAASAIVVRIGRKPLSRPFRSAVSVATRAPRRSSFLRALGAGRCAYVTSGTETGWPPCRRVLRRVEGTCLSKPSRNSRGARQRRRAGCSWRDRSSRPSRTRRCRIDAPRSLRARALSARRTPPSRSAPRRSSC